MMDPLTVVLATCPEAAKCRTVKPSKFASLARLRGPGRGRTATVFACEKTGFSEPCLSSLLLIRSFFKTDYPNPDMKNTRSVGRVFVSPYRE